MLPVACLLVALSAAPAPPPTADALALKMLDGEALYTVSGGLKPVSEGFWQTSFPATQDTSEQLEAVRKTLAGLPLGPDLETGVLIYSSAFEGKRSASVFVAHKPSLKALVERWKDVFGPIGVTSESSAQAVIQKIDRAPRAARWRAFGLVFGYPEYAVEFFVTAGEEQDRTGRLVPRDFLNIPTFSGERGRFVYAVPKGHTERDEDRELKEKAEPILTRYKAWRAVYVDEHRLGGVALLSAWVASTPAPAPRDWALVHHDWCLAPQQPRRRSPVGFHPHRYLCHHRLVRTGDRTAATRHRETHAETGGVSRQCPTPRRCGSACRPPSRRGTDTTSRPVRPR